MFKQLFQRKPLASHSHYHQLHRTLTAFDLTFMGIGAIIGAGVFVLTGVVAATKAGPAVVISYMIAGFAALLAALAYAELASSIGGAGSAYSYAYAGFGELVAWIIGWNLLLEYVAAVSTVAIGWSGYVVDLLQSIGIDIPPILTHGPFRGGILNLPAALVIFAIAMLLSLGIRQSARFNMAIVFIKLFTIGFFIAVGFFNFKSSNWVPFMPFGYEGVVSGAALVFFAYIGFDALSTAVEEAAHPERDVPIGIITSLAVCTLIYVIVSGLLTGMMSYTQLDTQSPVSDVLLNLGYRFAGGIIAAGAVAGLTSVLLIMFYGASRIFLAMSRDGLLPKRLAEIHPVRRTPERLNFILGTVMALLAAFLPIDDVAELVNIGTLAAFVFVCLGVIVFRYTHPDLHRPFHLPYNPLIPVLGVLSCVYLMLHLANVTWWRFIIWTFLGLIVYFLYGIKHSRLKASKD